MKRSKGDIRVIGMVGGTHVIEDLQIDVPYRSLVIIPENRALMSKDLWRAISQGCLMQLTSAPYPTAVTASTPDTAERARLEQYCTELEGHLVRLQSENETLRKQLETGASAQAAKLDAILNAIQTGVTVSAPPNVPGPTAIAPRLSVVVENEVDGAAPTFLPGQIVPKDLDARINIQGEESTSGAVSDAAERLRRMRRKGSDS